MVAETEGSQRHITEDSKDNLEYASMEEKLQNFRARHRFNSSQDLQEEVKSAIGKLTETEPGVS